MFQLFVYNDINCSYIPSSVPGQMGKTFNRIFMAHSTYHLPHGNRFRSQISWNFHGTQ